MPDIDDYQLPETTPRESLKPANKRVGINEAMNLAKRGSGTLPMRFDAGGKEEPLVEKPRLEDMPVPPSGGLGGVMIYRGAPFAKWSAEGAKKFTELFRSNPSNIPATPRSEGTLKSVVDAAKFAQTGGYASKEARAAMAEAGPPDRYDLSRVGINISKDKTYSTRHDPGGRATIPWEEKVENFPVSITVPGRKDPITIGTFERKGDPSTGGPRSPYTSRWYFDTNENVMLHLKEDRVPLLNAFKKWLNENNLSHYANEIKTKGLATRGHARTNMGENDPVNWYQPN